MVTSAPGRCAVLLVLAAGCRDFSTPTSLFGAPSPDLGPDLASSPDLGSSLNLVSRRCATLSPSPRLCVDFDEGDPIGAGWSQVEMDQGTSLSLDSSIAFSAPGSALARMIDAQSGCAYGRLDREWIGESATALSLELQLRPSSPWIADRSVTEIFLEDSLGGTPCGLFFVLDSSAAGLTGAFVQVQVYGVSDRYLSLPATRVPIIDAWTKVVFELHEQGGVPQLTVSTGGVEALSAPLGECKLGGHPRFAIGYHCEVGGPSEVRFDDVRFDFR